MITYASTSVPVALRTGLGRIVKAAQAYRMRINTQHALKKLDAHLLRDIGMTPPPRDEHQHLLQRSRISW